MKKLACAVAALLVVGWTSHASALVIMPGDASQIASGPETSQNAINAIIDPIIGNSDELYKENVGDGFDTGPFAGSYETVFLNTPLDPSGATITYIGGPTIPEIAYLLVKGGGPSFVAPLWYLFDLTTIPMWDGMETIDLSGFWPNQGAISHVTFYSDDSGGGIPLPEAGSLGLLGIGLIVIGLAARRRNTR